MFALSVPLVSLGEEAGENPEVQPVRKMTDAGKQFDPMVKMFVNGLDPQEAGLKTAKYVVTELQVDGLWEAMGIQLFELKIPDTGRHELFTCSASELKQVPMIVDHGVERAVVSDGNLYFTCKTGSGISRTVLVKLSREMGKPLTHEELGAIEADPKEQTNKELVATMADVIGKLKPVKVGSTKGPAPVPAA